jgi:hypothetical protein
LALDPPKDRNALNRDLELALNSTPNASEKNGSVALHATLQKIRPTFPAKYCVSTAELFP